MSTTPVVDVNVAAGHRAASRLKNEKKHGLKFDNFLGELT
jgi:hypothetical protein